MLKKNKNSNPMKKIISFLFFPILLFSQDLDFKALTISENETRIFFIFFLKANFVRNRVSWIRRRNFGLNRDFDPRLLYA